MGLLVAAICFPAHGFQTLSRKDLKDHSPV